jgi:hypothetical protein
METRVTNLKILNCKEFWDDSVLVVVVPSGNVFYAQMVSELEIKEWYNLNKDFLKIEEVFTRVKGDDILHFKDQALQIMKKT